MSPVYCDSCSNSRSVSRIRGHHCKHHHCHQQINCPSACIHRVAAIPRSSMDQDFSLLPIQNCHFRPAEETIRPRSSSHIHFRSRSTAAGQFLRRYCHSSSNNIASDGTVRVIPPEPSGPQPLGAQGCAHRKLLAAFYELVSKLL